MQATWTVSSALIVAVCGCLLSPDAFAAPEPRMLLQLGQSYGATGAIMSPNGKFVVTWSWEDRYATLWDWKDAKVLATLDPSRGIIYSAAFSPDSNDLAIGTEGDGIIICSTETGGTVQRIALPDQEDQVENLQYDAAGDKILASTAEGPVCLVNALSGKILTSWYAMVGDKKARARSAQLMADGSRILTYSIIDDENLPHTGGRSARSKPVSALQMHDAVTGKLIWDVPVEDGSLDFQARPLPDGGVVLEASSKGVIYSGATGANVGQFELPTQMNDVSVSPDGLYALFTGISSCALVSIPSGNLVKIISNQIGQGEGSIAPDGMVLVADREGTPGVQILSAGTFTPLMVLPTFRRPIINAIAESPDGRRLAELVQYLPTNSTLLLLFDTSTGELTGQIPLGNEWLIPSLAYSPDSRVLACDSDSGLSLFDVSTHTRLAFVPEQHHLALAPIRFSQDGRFLVTSDESTATPRVDFRSPKTGSVAFTIYFGGNVELIDYALSPDGKRIAVSQTSGQPPAVFGEVDLWSIARRAKLKTILTVPVGHWITDVFLRPICFTPDGRTLAVGRMGSPLPPAMSGDKSPTKAAGYDLYRVRDGAKIGQVPALGEQLLFSPNGDWLFSPTPAAWDIATGRNVWQFEGDARANEFLAGPASLASRSLTTAGQFSGISTLWNWRTGRRQVDITFLPMAGNQVQWISATPDGYYVCSTGAEKWISWRVGDQVLPASSYADQYNRPDMLRKALN